MTEENAPEEDETQPLTRADLKDMSPAAITAAHEAGELNHLIKESTSRYTGLTTEQAETIVNKFDNN
ncbi:hypothetical protein [Microbacterium maritypicum]|uniref:Uncharacterized protein n=1 Tax=Microbacterium maritypicum TaxID=33918 RepID=A0ACD4B4N9_MICMQ|nr:hypothetical protein [Microbacterium liquefaciens]UTT52317.1 hypothetical protein NMQ05_14720 [Microbacterium liquefaciens]